ncbi:MAG: glycine cleavage system aminomethyltransferase GcvT [Opitutales bacterium]|nr:glycine cleavage system aminomethyltransferase GcvT [Opitutales bacterium]
MNDLKKTPLYALHCELGARMVPFGGWDMPVQYSGIIAEHKAVRESAGLFDVSHMGELLVSGAGARRFLNGLVTNDVEKLEPGKALYTILCQPDGGCVDDIIIYQTGDDTYFICINAGNADKDAAWVSEKSAGHDCSVVNLSAQYGQLALQGPKAVEILSHCDVDTDVTTIGRFCCRETVLNGAEVLLSRTGYTGEDGFEIYCSSGVTEKVARHLLEKGAAYGLVPAGLGARDSLRLEAGYPLYGHEISEVITPLQAKLGWAVKLNKGCDFIGREALQQEKDTGIAKTVVFFTLNDKRIARQGTEVYAEGTVIGTVLSGTQSPVLGKPIGSALVESNAAKSGGLYVDLRGNKINLDVKKPPLHK